MSIFSIISGKFLTAIERRSQRIARRELLNMSDRQLEDFGISRHSLMEGVSAWPWKEALNQELAGRGLARIPAITTVTGEVPSTKVIKQAVDELNTYSDRELAELGVTRHSIEESVRNGRPAIEGAAETQRHVA